MNGSRIPKIGSGGQTGADRAALDWALSRRDRMWWLVPEGSKS
jgi:Circularly permutated YpsA SLOG family